jgi:hypothetical protein
MKRLKLLAVICVCYMSILSTILFAQMTWTQATANAGWSARSNHTSVVFDNKMWVIGGWDGSNRNDVWYSLNGINWTRATANAQWSARVGHTSVVFDNKIWVCGGFPYSNDVWYSSDGINWTQATANAGWSARTGHTSVVFNNKMWVIGGHYYSNYLNDVWYSTGLSAIEEGTTISASRITLNAEPNPFKTHTTIRYSLTASSNINLSIYDNSGKLVRNLVNEFQNAGNYNVSWDDRDNSDNNLPDGIYIYQLKTQQEVKQAQIILIK